MKITNKLEKRSSFSAILKERVGHHYFGEKWATNVKKFLAKTIYSKIYSHYFSEYA
jgi:hypothetical protein